MHHIPEIHKLLMDHGYPADGVADWWTDFSYIELGDRTPLQAWSAGAYDAVWSMLVAAYVASEKWP